MVTISYFLTGCFPFVFTLAIRTRTNPNLNKEFEKTYIALIYFNLRNYLKKFFKVFLLGLYIVNNIIV